MKEYLFFLGTNEELSLAELDAVLGVKVHKVFHGIAGFSGDLDAQSLQKQLGGTIKIAEVLAELPFRELQESLIDILSKENPEGKKWTLGVSYHGVDKYESSVLKNILIPLKKALPFSVRICNNNFKSVPTVVTLKQILYKSEKATELNLLEVSRGNFIVAKTLSCQDIDFYSHRDYEKPFRDAKNGMLPPKLAQLLLNIAGETRTIWDPFCGSGTVLIEALLLGKQVFGSDLSEDMIEGAKSNIEWMKDQSFIEGKYKLFQHDATEPLDMLADAIVTEGYLGEPKRTTPQYIELQKTDEMLADLYGKFFQEARRSRIQTIVICLPVYRMEKAMGFMKKTLARIQQSGYNPQALSPYERGSIVYSRPDQLVFREILKFRLRH